MAVEDPDDPQLETDAREISPTESHPREPTPEETTKQTDSEGEEEHLNDADRSKSVVTGGITLWATGVAAEVTRRLGIDRYLEADFAERAYAKAYAQKVGGTVIEDGTSVFTPDGGVDKIVKTSSGEIAIQSKHHGRAVGNSTLEEYAGKVDVIGATNGVAESANPEAYDVDVVTANDWPWRTKAKLQGKRILRGCRKGAATLKHGTRVVISRLVDGVKFVSRRAISGGKWFTRRLIKVGSTIAAWYTRRSLITQLILIVAVVGLLYLLWRWYTSEDGKTEDTDTGKDAK
ncbi:hypothetical protein [Halobaculum sp. EA56]|uniref:hypothetical protein n=1 Tax=Halobaculum sp. EA56 TaxID=3421648 RepID=UPI003EBD5F1B